MFCKEVLKINAVICKIDYLILSGHISCTVVALIAQLSDGGAEGNCSELASRVLELMEEFPSLDSSVKTHTSSASLQLHTMAITLWNLGVTLKAKDSASNELNAQCKSMHM